LFQKLNITNKNILAPSYKLRYKINKIKKNIVLKIFDDYKKENKSLFIRRIYNRYFEITGEKPFFSLETLRRFLRFDLKASYGKLKIKNNKLKTN